MNLTIKATKTTLTPAIKAAVADKLAILDRFLKSEDKVHVEFEVNKRHTSGQLFYVEVTIHPHGHFADSRGSDFYEALDLVLPKIKEQLVKAKGKRVSARKGRK